MTTAPIHTHIKHRQPDDGLSLSDPSDGPLSALDLTIRAQGCTLAELEADLPVLAGSLFFIEMDGFLEDQIEADSPAEALQALLGADIDISPDPEWPDDEQCAACCDGQITARSVGEILS